jgi:hypothetical protein
VPFEEQAALDELDRLRRELEETRQRRRQATDAFDSFLRSFATRPPARAASEVPAKPTQAVQIHEERSEPRPVDTLKVDPSKVEGPTASGLAELDEFPVEEFPPPPIPWSSESKSSGSAPHVPVAEEAGLTSFELLDERNATPTPTPLTRAHHVPAALAPVSRDPRRRWAMLAVAGIALTVVAVFAWRGSSPSRPEDPPAAGTPAGSARAEVSPAAPATTAAPAPLPVAEITTLRRVWVRVLVDGEPAIERELDANVHIPLTPKQRFLVRAGDAGAVRVLIAGKDQGRLGPDGQPATRAFVVAPAPPR